jgi:AcrR family transcriptional regulator
MRQFWLKGYDGTTITDLTNAMGISRPSLYNVFGNKEQLFQKALARYQAEQLAYIPEALNGDTAVEIVEHLLAGCVLHVTGSGQPPGSLSVHAIVASADGSEQVRAALVEIHDWVRSLLRDRFARAGTQDGRATPADAAALADYTMAVGFGLAVMAKIGTSRSALLEAARVAETAFRRN